MDADTLKTVADLLAHGGSVGMLVAAFIAGRSLKTVGEAAETLKRIERRMTETGHQNRVAFETARNKLSAIHSDVQSLPLSVARIVSARKT